MSRFRVHGLHRVSADRRQHPADQPVRQLSGHSHGTWRGPPQMKLWLAISEPRCMRRVGRLAMGESVRRRVCPTVAALLPEFP